MLAVSLLAAGLLTVPAAQASAGLAKPECTVLGSKGDDVLRGTPGNDVICGFGGNDRVFGFGGNDILRGGAGHDTLNGGSGDDDVFGGPGDDHLVDGSGDDDFIGGPGREVTTGSHEMTLGVDLRTAFPPRQRMKLVWAGGGDCTENRQPSPLAIPESGFQGALFYADLGMGALIAHCGHSRASAHYEVTVDGSAYGDIWWVALDEAGPWFEVKCFGGRITCEWAQNGTEGVLIVRQR